MSQKKIFCNTPELITREARWLIFYDKEKLSFNQNFKGELPPIEDYLFKVRVNTVQRFGRGVERKIKEFNSYTQVKLVEQFYPIKSSDIELLESYEKKNAYVVLLVTNDDTQVFGNTLEPMSFRIEDGIQDNASGNDHYRLIVEGVTTIKLKRHS